MHAQIQTCVYIHECIPPIHICEYTYTNTNINECVHSFMHTCIHALTYIHTYMHAYMCVGVGMFLRVCVHARTDSLALTSAPALISTSATSLCPFQLANMRGVQPSWRRAGRGRVRATAHEPTGACWTCHLSFYVCMYIHLYVIYICIKCECVSVCVCTHIIYMHTCTHTYTRIHAQIYTCILFRRGRKSLQAHALGNVYIQPYIHA